MFEAVAGQDHDWSVVREPSIDQCLRDGSGADARLAVGQVLPHAGGVAPCEKRPLGRAVRPVLEALRNLVRVRPQCAPANGRRGCRPPASRGSSPTAGCQPCRSISRNVRRSTARLGQQRCRRPPVTQFLDGGLRCARGSRARPGAIGVEHRAAAPCREAVAVQIDDVDVRGALRRSPPRGSRAPSLTSA